MADDLAQLRGEVRALVADWRERGRFIPVCDAWLRSYDLDFTRELAGRGWIGITWPADLGGAARPYTARLVLTEELLAAGAPVAAHWIADRQIGPAILRYGAPALQAEFLPAIAAGQVTFCLGMSEPEAGSDLAAVRTTARRDGDGWRLAGAKIWTSHAHRASHAYVLARTSPPGGDRHAGLTEFVVAMDSPGVTVRPILDLQGEHHFNEVHFDDVAVPDRWVIGEVGNGWQQVTAQLSFERGGMERVLSTYPLLAALADSVAQAGEPAAVAAVGELAARLSALRELAWQIALAMDAGQAPAQPAAMLKLLGTTFERDVTEVARWVADVEPEPAGQGLAGLLGQGILAAPGFSIRGGTSEVLAGIIARGQARR